MELWPPQSLWSSHRPGTRQLYSSENGPHCDDEINVVKRGRNYGWGPGYDCGTTGVGTNPKGPLFRWATTIAPTDLTWYEGRLRALSGALYVGDFNTERLRRLNLRRGRVTAERPIYHSLRQITDVMKGPRGDLFFSTMVGVFRITRRR